MCNLASIALPRFVRELDVDDGAGDPGSPTTPVAATRREEAGSNSGRAQVSGFGFRVSGLGRRYRGSGYGPELDPESRTGPDVDSEP